MATTKKTVSQETIDKVGGEDNLRRLTLKDESKNTTLEVVACIPDRVVMGEYLKFNNVNPKKAQEILVNSCILTDKEEVKSNDWYFNGAVAGIAELIPIAATVVEKY